MPQSYRVVHYINQFFAGIGGEDMAGVEVSFREGPIGPGLALTAALAGQASIVSTIICGDNYFSDRQAEVLNQIVRHVQELGADVLVAGPAFNAGRYGMACAAVCEAVQERLGIQCLTALYLQSPAVESYRRSVVIVPTDATALGMRKAMAHLARLIRKLADGQELDSPQVDGYIPHGFRKLVLVDKSAAQRAVEMLLAKLAGRPYETEVPLSTYEQIPPAPALQDLSHARLALVTEGGLVPKGNPDRIRHVWASNWAAYSMEGQQEFSAGAYEGVHGGFDRTWVDEDPDRLLPLDILRELEQQSVFDNLWNEYYVTVGNGTPVENCQRFGQEIAQRLLRANVRGVILSAT